nr:DUF6850 family outer membrane beta-barrel protein [uncultured Bacteroides sp.]
MFRNSYLLYLALFISIPSFGQNDYSLSLQKKEKRDLELVQQLWMNTQNAAGLSLMPIENGGISVMSVGRTSGSFNRVQEGNAENKLSFSSERFDRIGESIYIYGKFDFNMSRQFERSWSDVLETYNSDPYIYGSSLKGKYDYQKFNLFAKIATKEIKRFTFGTQISYTVSDFSRLKDPRSRDCLADYSIIPSTTYRLNKTQIIGLNLKYRHRKEKTPSVMTVQTDPNMKYYTFTGMENVEGKTGGYSSFKREFVNDIFGIGFDYNFRSGKLNSLNSITFDSEKESIWGTNKQSPGNYKEKVYAFSSYNTYKSEKALHSLEINAKISDGKANEFRQELISKTDTATGIISQHWNTLFIYKGRYTVSMNNILAHYRRYSLKNENKYNSYIGAMAQYSSFSNQYNLPLSSLKVSNLSGGIEGGVKLLGIKSHSLWFESQASYMHVLNAEMNLSNSSSDYAKQVLIPDMEYYNSSCVRANASLQYVFPLKFKSSNNTGYIKLWGENTWAKSSREKRSIFLSIGIYTD